MLVDGSNNPAAVSSGTYTFTAVSATHTIAASFVAKPVYAISGQVTDSVSGNPIAGAKVYVSTTANASYLPYYTLTTDGSGNYSLNLFNATWYVCASATGYSTSADSTVTVAGAAQSGKNFSLVASGRNIPQMDQLLFALYGNALTTSGATTNAWPLEHPKGRTAPIIGAPTLATVDGVQWESNRYASGDGYTIGQYSAPIPINGLTATAVVQPQGDGVNGGNWASVIDVMYSRFIVAIQGTGGMLRVCRNGAWTNGPNIPNGQKTVLTAVVQPTGQYVVYANGVQVMQDTTTSAMTSLDPYWNGGGLGYWSYITVGRNFPDGWTTYKGNIDSAFLWKTVLSASERVAFETELGTTVGIAMPVFHNITASAGTGGTISPSGVVQAADSGNQTFTITASSGYRLAQVLVDGVNNPTAVSTGTYTFTTVTTTHTIDASFVAIIYHDITASAGSNGTIGPAGTIPVEEGTNKTFTITPADAGYRITQVLVDGVNNPTAVSTGTYTFQTVTTTHTIDASFVAIVYHDITASAGSNGTISPAGTIPVEEGTNKTFTITPVDVGYRIAQVLVDGVNDPTAVSTGTYTFSAVTTTHTIAATFVAKVQWTVSGKVTDKMTGAGVAGANVYFSTTPNAKTSPVYTATTNGSGNYSQVAYEGSYYLASDATHYYTSADTVLNVTGDTTNINLTLIPTVRNIPRTSDLLFSVVTDTLPSSGSTGPWATYLPAGQTLATLANPQAEVIDGVKWERNTALTSIAPDVWESDGFRLATYTDPIPVNGASAVTAVRPVRNTKGTSWTSVVDVMYNRMVVGVYNHTGQVVAFRNGLLVNSGSYTIPDGQKTVLSVVVQPTGEFNVYANGIAVITNTTTSDMTALVPNVPGAYANAINLGRNNPDGWTSFNGDIGDVFLYKVALSASERSQVETDVASKFGITMQHSITSSAASNGTITPSGTTLVADAGSQAYSITAASGFFVDVVTVDGVAQSGHPTSYTFTHVTADHTISATFTATLNPYAEWTNRFTFAVGADQTPTGDPDGDGMTNQQEFAFGLDPTKGSSCDPIVVPFKKDTRTFSYTRYASSGLGYTVWTSPDLGTWTQDATASQVPGTPDPVTGVEVVAVTLTDPLPSGTKLFVRVQAE